MKTILFMLSIVVPFLISGQVITIDHNCIDLESIPMNWIESAKENLFIGYGHTSHGSQLTSGMNAVESYYSNGNYNWSHSGGPGELHLFEGSGYSSGYLELDCGYTGWDTETRDFLDDHPDCNVIIWSWCGQVNSVDLPSHYLGPMQQLESEYPDVQFVYMTGHLEGQGPEGSLHLANQQIRDFCAENDKILFDFADIEKYDPDALMNYQDYFADDACNYNPPSGGTANWANDWLGANPDHQLSQISQLCSSCAHSVSLNCVKKGIACWYLWARLAGWDGTFTGLSKENNHSGSMKIYPQPFNDKITISIPANEKSVFVKITNMLGKTVLSESLSGANGVFKLQQLDLTPGVFIVTVNTGNETFISKIVGK